MALTWLMLTYTLDKVQTILTLTKCKDWFVHLFEKKPAIHTKVTMHESNDSRCEALRKVAWFGVIAKQTAKLFSVQALRHHWAECLETPGRSLANISSW